MKALLFASLVVYVEFCVAQTTPPACPTEGIQQISTCYTAYFNNFNFTSIPNMQAYDQAFEHLFAQGITAFKQLCQWVNTRKACIGSYDPICVTETAFASALRVSSSDAYGYLSFYRALNWECSAGYQDMINNFYCLENIHVYHNDERFKCYEVYNATINQQGFSCSAFATYVQCYANVYKKYCGAEGWYIGCNEAREGAVADAPFCASQIPPCTKYFEMNRVVGLRYKFAVANSQTNQNI